LCTGFQFETFPEWALTFTQIVSLQLNNCGIGGIWPDNLSNLRHLENLKLKGNPIRGFYFLFLGEKSVSLFFYKLITYFVGPEEDDSLSVEFLDHWPNMANLDVNCTEIKSEFILKEFSRFFCFIPCRLDRT